jgi:hypothetical protein
VDRVVMIATDQHQVRQGRGAAGGHRNDVMGVAAFDGLGAAGEPAAAVTHDQRGVQRRGDFGVRGGHAEDVGAVGDDGA